MLVLNYKLRLYLYIIVLLYSDKLFEFQWISINSFLNRQEIFYNRSTI